MMNIDESIYVVEKFSLVRIEQPFGVLESWQVAGINVFLPFKSQGHIRVEVSQQCGADHK